MYRVKLYLYVLIVKFVLFIISEGYAVNSSRKERSFSDSFETLDFSHDRYIPRFYLNRTKNRFSHFQSEFFNANKTSEDKVDRLYEQEPSSIRPLAWHDFPQLINKKLAAANEYKNYSSATENLAIPKVNNSILSNFSQIVPKFPIYFTNPSTGVVYAITEVKSPNIKLKNYTASGINSPGTTKSYDDGKYTLQCTMVDAFTRPAKKTMLPSNHGGTNIPALKKKKSKKKSGNKRIPPSVQYPKPSATSVFNANITHNIHKQSSNVTRLVPKITKTLRPSTTSVPLDSVFSNKRKVTKRMVPPTVPTNIFPSAATTLQSKLVEDESEEDESDEFFYEESYFDSSLSSEKKKKRIKRHQHAPKGNSTDNVNATQSENDSSSSEEDEDFDYMNQLMSPLQDVFETLSQRAVGILISKNKEESEHIDKPHYTMFGSDLSNYSKPNNKISWFGSWFFNSEPKTNINEKTTSTTAPTKGLGWFDYWYDENDENGEPATTEVPQGQEQLGSRWLFNWFGGNSDTTTKKSPSTTTTTTTQIPFLPFHTLVQNTSDWFGILANNLINNTLSQKSTMPTHLNGSEPHKINYDGFQIWRLRLKGQSDLRSMDRYKNSEEGAKLQWLKGPSIRGPTDVIIPPKMATDFLGTLNYENIRRDVLIFDLKKAINYDIISKTVIDVHKKANRFPMTWTKYHGYEDIIRFLEYIQIRHPHLVELIHIGRTYEGRPLVIAKITNRNRNRSITNKRNKKHKKEKQEAKEVFIEAGAHGREWIGPAAATWIIKELIKIFRSNDTASTSIKNATWYILPVLNPDGYEYSHDFDRFWRKSRSKHISKPTGIIDSAMAWIQQDKHEKVCFGVDLNRNWDYKWGKKGSSKSPCNEFYAGPNAFSEPETRALSNFLMNKRKNIKLFVSLHAYGQVISYPNNVSIPLEAQKVDDMMEVSMMGLENLRMSGSTTRYKINVGNDMKAVQSGTSETYAAYGVGIPFSYTIDLSDDGVHGFLLPGSFIEATSRDAFEIIKGMLDYF